MNTRTIRTAAMVAQFAFAVVGLVLVFAGWRVPGLVLFGIGFVLAVVPIVVPKPPPFTVRLTPEQVAAIREERAARGRFAAARSLRKQHPGMPFAQAMAIVQYA
jgi:MFS family permease